MLHSVFAAAEIYRKVQTRLINEALIIFLLGGLPLIASHFLGGAKELEAMIGALITKNSFLTYYLVALFGAFLVVGGKLVNLETH